MPPAMQLRTHCSASRRLASLGLPTSLVSTRSTWEAQWSPRSPASPPADASNCCRSSVLAARDAYDEQSSHTAAGEALLSTDTSSGKKRSMRTSLTAALL